MVDRLLTEKIRAAMLNAGMDLVGFGPVERWEHAPYLLSPQAILPEAQTVIVGAVYILDGWMELGGEPTPQDHGPGSWMDQNALLDRTAYRIARLLSDEGHAAIAVASSNIWRYRAYEGIPSLFAPDLSHIHAAVAAGLGEIGWSGLALTPEFGSRCRFISIVTSAALTPTPMYDGPPLCDRCGDCIRHCPSGAMKGDLNSRTPQTVQIGGKTYQYLHKNMWRCAWAEHFNLDLASPTLQETAHIDEATILRELADKGVRGHERGVCQKVCIPPHLRSDRPSFGRPDKLITQARINRRYPESMPTLRKMRDDILAKAVELGMELAVVEPLRADTEFGRWAMRDIPGVQTILAFAFRVPPEARTVPLPQKSHEVYQYAVNQKMHQAQLRLARFIEDYGYCAGVYTGGAAGYNDLVSVTGLCQTVDGQFVTPEFGVAVMTGAITTDAPLDPTPQVDDAVPARPLPAVPPAVLRRELEELAQRQLVSLFGVAPVARVAALTEQLRGVVDEAALGQRIIDANTHTPLHGAFIPQIVQEDLRLRTPEDYVPGARSVLVLGMHYPDELIQNAGLEKSRQIGCYNFHQYQTRYELMFAALEVATRLRRRGFRTMIVENLLGVGSYTDSPRYELPDMRCGALEAVAAGLGELGASGALLTPDHGPHQRCICIVTDAELPADAVQPPTGVCRTCAACRDRCPMTALTAREVILSLDGIAMPYPLVDRHRCDWAKRYSLHPDEGPALIGACTPVAPPAGEIGLADLAAACAAKDPVMKHRTCILEPCLRHCPAGFRRADPVGHLSCPYPMGRFTG
jgi:epoxyqueuosine reductase